MARPAVVLLRSLASRARRLGPERLLSWVGAPAHATALTVPTIGTSRQNDVEIPSGTLPLGPLIRTSPNCVTRVEAASAGGGAPPAMEDRDDAMVSDGGPVLRRAVTH